MQYEGAVACDKKFLYSRPRAAYDDSSHVLTATEDLEMHVKIHDLTHGIPWKKAPAGSFVSILTGEYKGSVAKMPFCTSQAIVFLDRNIASSDRYAGMGDDTRVRVLQPGESFTVTL